MGIGVMAIRLRWLRNVWVRCISFALLVSLVQDRRTRIRGEVAPRRWGSYDGDLHNRRNVSHSMVRSDPKIGVN
jgi:hypothetical protein